MVLGSFWKAKPAGDVCQSLVSKGLPRMLARVLAMCMGPGREKSCKEFRRVICGIMCSAGRGALVTLVLTCKSNRYIGRFWARRECLCPEEPRFQSVPRATEEHWSKWRAVEPRRRDWLSGIGANEEGSQTACCRRGHVGRWA